MKDRNNLKYKILSQQWLILADIRAYGAEKSEIPHAEQCNEHI